MKRIRLTYLIVVLTCTLFHGSVFAQIMPPDLYVLQVYPTQPSSLDSVYVILTYTSNDGCPDYYLEIDSVESFMVSVATRKIDNSTRICTQAFTKFSTRINLGPLGQKTQIYVDGALIQTINPNCSFDRKGVVVMGTGDCAWKLLISEHTPYASLLPVLYTMDNVIARNADGTASTGFKPGDEVRFGAILRAPATNNTCHIVGDAVCCEITSTKPDCLMNKTGVIVPGIDGCTGQWFVKDLSPVYSYPRLYLINEGPVKAGAKVIFGSTDYPKDSSMSILCTIFGIVNCFIFAEPLYADTLAGTAYTGDSVVKGGTAILFQRGIRKAMRANALINGRFEFPNVATSADYTVYVIPDRRLNTGYLPTFYINKLAFKNADYFTVKDGMNEIAVNLRPFVKRPGTGKIYGNIYFETSNLKDSILNYYGDKNYLYTTDNNMAINLPVILFNSEGVPIAWTMSDESGNYVFDNIALDSYRIVTESAESQAESTVSLTQENAVVGADMVLKIQNVIDELPIVKTESFSLYPNPVSDKLFVQTSTGNTVRIYNSLGQLMMDRFLPAGKNELDVQNLNQGVYFVKMGMYTQKLIRK